MTDKPIDFDQHREMAAQQATELRHLILEVEAGEAALPGESWLQTVAKARYLCELKASEFRFRKPLLHPAELRERKGFLDHLHRVVGPTSGVDVARGVEGPQRLR